MCGIDFETKAIWGMAQIHAGGAAAVAAAAPCSPSPMDVCSCLLAPPYRQHSVVTRLCRNNPRRSPTFGTS